MVSYPVLTRIFIFLIIQKIIMAVQMSLDTRGTPLINRTIQSEYPPGSTFKMVAAVIIAEEVVPFSKTYFCNRSFRLNNQ